jgi:hypothetical protein
MPTHPLGLARRTVAQRRFARWLIFGVQLAVVPLVLPVT